MGLFTTHGTKGRGFESPPRRFLFEECIASGWPREEDEEQEQEQEDHGRVKQEELGRRRRHSDQEWLREMLRFDLAS